MDPNAPPNGNPESSPGSQGSNPNVPSIDDGGGIEVALDLDAYRGFYDEKWARDMKKETGGTPIKMPAFCLMMSFFAQSQAREMPVTMMNLMKETVTAALSSRKPFAAEVIDAFVNRICQEPDGTRALSNGQLEKARNLMREAEAVVNSKRGAEIVEVNLKDFWEKWVKEDCMLALSLWRSELNAYSGLYFAYDDFVRQSYFAIRGKKLGPKPADALKHLFGDDLTKACWTHEGVNAARLIRNAIAHAGGRITENIKQAQPKLHVRTQGDLLVIGADETTRLHALLAERSLIFAKAAVQKAKSLKD